MDEPFLEFEWSVAPAHEWSDLIDENHELVIAPTEAFRSRVGVEAAWKRLEAEGKATGPLLRPLFESGDIRRYGPMRREHAALFRIFAELDYGDREAIRSFANTYGLLGMPTRRYGGESHLTWAREICLMQEALELGQPATAAAEEKERAIWREHDAALRSRWRKQGRENEDPAEYRRQERRDKLGWLFNSHLQHVQGRMTFDPGVPPRLTFRPLTLLAAMWLQLSQAVAGDKRFLACKSCRRLFEISTEQTGFRSHREFCSDVCKTTDYRRRKRTALQLATKRLSIREIAKATETKSATVRGWIASSKRRNTIAKHSRRNST